jgi:hypothetical protein
MQILSPCELLVYPRSEKPEYIAKCEEHDESDHYIYSPSFCFLGILFTIASPRHHDARSDDRKDAEKEDDIHKPAYDSSYEFLKRRESFIDCAFVFPGFDFITIRSLCTGTVCSWYFFSYGYHHRSSVYSFVCFFLCVSWRKSSSLCIVGIRCLLIGTICTSAVTSWNRFCHLSSKASNEPCCFGW